MFRFKFDISVVVMINNKCFTLMGKSEDSLTENFSQSQMPFHEELTLSK